MVAVPAKNWKDLSFKLRSMTTPAMESRKEISDNSLGTDWHGWYTLRPLYGSERSFPAHRSEQNLRAALGRESIDLEV